VLTRAYGEFLRTQQDLLLKILDAVKAAGTALALPTQATISYLPNQLGLPVAQGLMPAGRT
jgi:hypothetical protein